MRGERFIKSLNDGRTVWLDGNKVTHLDTHPAFRGTLLTIRNLFDSLDDPLLRDQVGYRIKGREAYAHSSFLVPHTPEQLAKRSQSFAFWSKQCNGMMSGSPIMLALSLPDGMQHATSSIDWNQALHKNNGLL